MRRAFAVAAVAALGIIGCKRNKPTPLDAIWLSKTNGCARTKAAAGKPANLVCWGGPSHAAPHVVRPIDPATDQGSCTPIDDGIRCTPEPPRVDVPMPAGLAPVVEVATGDRHTCVRHANGTVSCWGANDSYQLANGTTEPSARPIAIFGLSGVTHITAAGDSTCVLLTDGEARCWGKNDSAQLGDGTTTPHNVPSAVKSAR